MDETQYHALANPVLEHCFNALEAAYDSGALEELELNSDSLTMIMPSGKTLLLSKHTASRQIWLATPSLGGLHFRHSEGDRWCLPDGQELYALLTRELAQYNVKAVL